MYLLQTSTEATDIDWNPWIALATLAATIILALVFTKAQNKIMSMQERASRPLLNFGQLGGEWRVFNLGGTPALQLRFSEVSYNDGTKTHTFKYKGMMGYGLPAQSAMVLADEHHKVIKDAHVLVATYFDANDQEFMTYCRSDTNHIYQRDKSGMWKGRKDNPVSHSELIKIAAHLQNEPQRTGYLDYTKIFAD